MSFLQQFPVLLIQTRSVPKMSEIDPTLLTKIRTTVIRWFNAYGRPFPWRQTSDPYQILVAEIMLRRTTAAAVSRIYPEFMRVYPDASSLSKSSLQDIQKSVRNLGLQYQRSRHLRDMAISINKLYNGDVSAIQDDLRTLPGVGRYVAAAVRNFAFELPEPMVDGNITHFLKRVLGISLTGPHDENAWRIMQSIGGRKQDKRLYWGIIDIVSTLCLRKKPRCSDCPVDRICFFSKQ